MNGKFLFGDGNGRQQLMEKQVRVDTPDIGPLRTYRVCGTVF